MAAITVNNLTKCYGSLRALDSLDLSVDEGQIYAFIGPNGAGKTTTIRLLLNLINPTEGEITLLGLKSKGNDILIRKQIGFLPGELSFYGNLKGSELLTYFANLRKYSDKTYTKTLARRLDIDLSRKIGELSKGNKQKLGIIQALMHRPELIILDEPTSGLDPLAQQEFHEILFENKQDGKTIFLSSHVLTEVEKIADRVGFIRDGKLIIENDMRTLTESSQKFVEIKFSEHVEKDDLKKIPNVSQVMITDEIFQIIIKGPIEPFIKAIARYSITDLTIRDQDLEEIFMTYYLTNKDNSS
jgi:ABC-2 type transport system ATP-binding protein